MNRVAIAVAASLVAGCADNAFLELALELPAAAACGGGAVSDAAIEGRFLGAAEPDCPAVDWNTGVEVFALGDVPLTSLVDVEAAGDDVELDLCLRVRFCTIEDCDGHDLEVHPSTSVALERPFVRGRRTAYRLPVDDPCAVRRVLEPVPRCDVDHACE